MNLNDQMWEECIIYNLIHKRLRNTRELKKHFLNMFSMVQVRTEKFKSILLKFTANLKCKEWTDLEFRKAYPQVFFLNDW